MEILMNIKILHADDNLIVLDKPAGILVHPTMANEKNTLVDWLTEKYPEIKKLDWPDKTRVGVVHRLDKNTSGLVVMAKTPEVLAKLQEQFQKRGVRKTYLALVLGKVEKKGKIEADITRGDAGLQKVIENNYSFSPKTHPAVTGYQPIKHYCYKNNDLTLLEVAPKTGRMHQIRVHLKYIGFPIVGDPLYNIKSSRNLSKELGVNRQFLHASKLEFIHPQTNKKLSFGSTLPDDLQSILNKIK